MLPARAADGDGELLLAFGDVSRHDAVEQRAPALHELDRFLAIHHEIANRSIETCEEAQVGIVIRVRKEAHVHDEVGVGGGAVLETERVHRNGQAATLVSAGENRADGFAQLLREHVGGVDDMMRHLAQIVEHLTLALDALRNGSAVGAQRVATTRGLVTSDKLVVRSVEEQHAHVDPLALELLDLALQIGKEIAVARVAHHSEASARIGLAGHALEREQIPNKARRQVVDTEEAQVLEDVHRLGAPGTAHARDDDDLGHVLERDRILFERPLSAVLVLVLGNLLAVPMPCIHGVQPPTRRQRPVHLFARYYTARSPCGAPRRPRRAPHGPP